MAQPLNYLRETASQTAGPYVHIGLAPGAAGFQLFEKELGGDIAGPNARGERIRVEGVVLDGTGAPIKDVLIEAHGVTRSGRPVTFTTAEMGFSYRNAAAAEGVIFTRAVLRGTPDGPAAVTERMEALLARREASQPIRERTGGSTFRNPAGFSSTGQPGDSDDLKAWTLIDRAGCRGLQIGGARVSDKHCNFLINTGTATAADLETLGETVRERVKSNSGIDLHWEIRRAGVILTPQ